MANLFDALSGSDDQDTNTDVGGLLGGPRDSQIEPIVGKQAISAARQNALLNFGASLLRNSGPSRMPVTLASAMGSAIGDAQTAYQSALDNGVKTATQAQALRMAQLNYGRQRMLMNIANQIVSGGQGNLGGSIGAGSAGVAGNNQPGIAGAGGAGFGSVGAGGGGAGMQPVGATNAAQSGVQRNLASSPGLLDALTLLDPEHQAGYQNIWERNNPSLTVAPDGTVINPHDQGNIGRSLGKLPDGMIRNADGSVGWAPGYMGAQAQNEMQHNIIGAATDFVPETQADGTVRMVPKLGQLGLTIGANGLPQLNLGGNGYKSAQSPAEIKEQEGDVAQFLSQRQDAVTKSAAATDSLRQYANLNTLLPQIQTGAGAAGQVELMNVLDRAGLLGPAGSDKLAAMKQFQQGLSQAALSSVKSIFPQRVSNYETQSVLKTFSTMDDPKAAIQGRLDTLQAAAQAAQDRSNFFQNYTGPRAKAEQAYEASPEGKKQLADYPVMWRNFPIDQPKPGSAAAQAGVVRVNIPGGRKVFAVPDGQGGYQPYNGGQ